MSNTFESMDIIDSDPPRIDALDGLWEGPQPAAIDMLRLDLLDPIIGGNKIFKLHRNFEQALAAGFEQVLSFGGAFSNHLVALAAMANRWGFPSIGVVRGKEWAYKPSCSLEYCARMGMKLYYVDRKSYRNGSQMETDEQLAAFTGNRRTWVVPAGGANAWGLQGAAQIGKWITPKYSHVAVAAGTGTTAIALRNALPRAIKVWAYTPLKGGARLIDAWREKIIPEKREDFQVFDHGAGKGFGRHSASLIQLMNAIYQRYAIPLDQVYTAKMVDAVVKQGLNGAFHTSDRLLLIHTGGLQGNASLDPGVLSF